MALLLVAYLGGILTILSPCILPVLPFVLARSDRRFISHGLPLLLGMAGAFVLVGSLAAVVGDWAVTANRIGRHVALVVMALFGLALLWPALATRLSQPFVALGNRLTQTAAPAGDRHGVLASLALGVATGLLWAPCAGPILGLIFGTAALQGTSTKTSLLLLAYALGAATALALALLAGARVFAALKSGLGATEGLRRVLGVLVLVSAIAIFFGLDTGMLARLSTASTNRIEQALLERAGAGSAGRATPGSGTSPAQPLPNIQPSFAGGGPWLNSQPLDMAALKGKVVLVDFWTYSCINCLRALPYVRAWYAKYRAAGLMVIGVHTPEFAFERVTDNVRRATRDLQIEYPVVLDNDYAVWRAFQNRFWPAHFFLDATGRLRHLHFGEGGYDESERMIQRLLAEAGAEAPTALVEVRATGAAAAADHANVLSPETYLGYQRAKGLVSPGGAVRDAMHEYTDGMPALNEWSLAGQWQIGLQQAAAQSRGARITYVFHARDLHLVLGPGAAGKPIRFRVTLDGQPPGADHGMDVDAQGYGSIDSQRLFQLIRQQGAIAERRFQIEFLDAGAEAYAFTFG
ncbi:MAG: cytochrome c biogenesis protein DipZ [Steroidobacteraceae bacterium]